MIVTPRVVLNRYGSFFGRCLLGCLFPSRVGVFSICLVVFLPLYIVLLLVVGNAFQATIMSNVSGVSNQHRCYRYALNEPLAPP
jgi:hypothetical protein